MATGTGPCVPKPIVTTNNKETNVHTLFQAALSLPVPVVVIERYHVPSLGRAHFHTDESYQGYLDGFYAHPLNERRISVEVRTANVSPTNWR